MGLTQEQIESVAAHSIYHCRGLWDSDLDLCWSASKFPTVVWVMVEQRVHTARRGVFWEFVFWKMSVYVRYFKNQSTVIIWILSWLLYPIKSEISNKKVLIKADRYVSIAVKKNLKNLSLKSTVMSVGGAASAAENALAICHTLYTILKLQKRKYTGTVAAHNISLGSSGGTASQALGFFDLEGTTGAPPVKINTTLNCEHQTGGPANVSRNPWPFCRFPM